MSMIAAFTVGRWHRSYGERLLRRYGIEHADEARLGFYRLLDEFF